MNEKLPQELAVLGEAHRALAQAQTVEEVKELRDRAEAARTYAQRAMLGLEKQNQCAAYKLSCERKAGLLLMELNVHGGRPAKEKRSQDATVLADLGINKSQSSRWQREARVPEELFELYVAKAQEEGKEVTAAGLLRVAREQIREGQSRDMDSRRKAGRSKRSPSMILDSIAFGPDQALARSDAVRELIGDVQDHFQELERQLVEYTGDGKLDKPKPVKRRYVRRLLREMGEMLAAVAAALEAK
ncbi:MAG: hypothetical protein WD894_25335 [Pirellulales bacterium]